MSAKAHRLCTVDTGEMGPRRLAVGDWQLHCGDGLEVWVVGVWLRGRAEFAAQPIWPIGEASGYPQGYRGWYFTGGEDSAGWCPLAPGMIARLPE